MMDEEKYNSLQERLRKLLALAEKGEGGEAVNARKIFDKLCEEYGFTLEDINPERLETKDYVFKVGMDEMYRQLFFSCALSIGLGDRGYYKQGKDKVVLECNVVERAELMQMFEWHKAHLKKERERTERDLLLAYRMKHRLWDDSKEDNEEQRKMTHEELQRLLRCMRMKGDMSDEKYISHKLLTT